MRPYAIGHEILLWSRKNALVTYTPNSFEELPFAEQHRAITTAALVCYRTWDQNQKPEKNLALWNFFNRRKNIPDEVARFQDYRAAGALDLPTVKMPRAGNAPFHYFGAPECARLLNYVTAHHSALIASQYGTPFDFPLGLARILYATEAETAGNLWVQNHQDAETAARAEAYEAAHPEPGIAVGDAAVQALTEKWNLEHPEAKVPLIYPPQPKGPTDA